MTATIMTRVTTRRLRRRWRVAGRAMHAPCASCARAAWLPQPRLAAVAGSAVSAEAAARYCAASMHRPRRDCAPRCCARLRRWRLAAQPTATRLASSRRALCRSFWMWSRRRIRRARRARRRRRSTARTRWRGAPSRQLHIQTPRRRDRLLASGSLRRPRQALRATAAVTAMTSSCLPTPRARARTTRRVCALRSQKGR